MTKWFEVWDQESGNLLADFATREEAQAFIEDTVAVNSHHPFISEELKILEQEDESLDD